METNQKDQDESALALILAEVKKLTKHFKLDRKSKSNPDDPDGVENRDEGDKLLREVLELIKEISRSANRKEFTPEQKTSLKSVEDAVNKALRDYRNAEHREIKSELEVIKQALDELKTAKQDSAVHHRHSIEIASSKVFLSIIVLGLMILVLSFIVGSQRRTLAQLRSNDLMYRYIRMKGEADPKDILMLREVFEFHPNPDSIRSIRHQVVEYEQLVREQAEQAAQAKLNAAEAERLKNEAETVKGGR